MANYAVDDYGRPYLNEVTHMTSGNAKDGAPLGPLTLADRQEIARAWEQMYPASSDSRRHVLPCGRNGCCLCIINAELWPSTPDHKTYLD